MILSSAFRNLLFYQNIMFWQSCETFPILCETFLSKKDHFQQKQWVSGTASPYHKLISTVTSKWGRSTLSGKNPSSCFSHILKFFTQGFEEIKSSFYLILKICYQALNSACGYIYASCSGSFI